MSAIHTWNVAILGQTLAAIELSASVFLSGTVNPNQSYSICNPLVIRNTGTSSGLVYWKAYKNSTGNPADFVPITGGNCSGSATVAANQTTSQVLTATSPTSGTWYLGVKVWGASETEPTGWSLLLQYGETNPLVFALLIGGLIGLPLYLGLKK